MGRRGQGTPETRQERAQGSTDSEVAEGMPEVLQEDAAPPGTCRTQQTQSKKQSPEPSGPRQDVARPTQWPPTFTRLVSFLKECHFTHRQSFLSILTVMWV